MRLRYLATSLSLAVILALALNLSFAEEKPPFLGEINAKDINLRQDATIASKVISVLREGERVEIVSESYDWYKARLPKSVPVYVKKNLAACIKYEASASVAATPSVARCSSAKILGNRVNLRAKPSQDAPIVGVADYNEIVNVLAESGSWYKVEPIQNSFGWVNKRFVKRVVLPKKEPASPRETAANPAIFTGIVEPYGVVFMRKATHKLVTPEQKIYLLKGNYATLNALNRQKVKVTGKITSPSGAKYPTIEVKIIEVAA